MMTLLSFLILVIGVLIERQLPMGLCHLKLGLHLVDIESKTQPSQRDGRKKNLVLAASKENTRDFQSTVP